jgi:hypothetical protein
MASITVLWLALSIQQLKCSPSLEWQPRWS